MRPVLLLTGHMRTYEYVLNYFIEEKVKDIDVIIYTSKSNYEGGEIKISKEYVINRLGKNVKDVIFREDDPNYAELLKSINDNLYDLYTDPEFVNSSEYKNHHPESKGHLNEFIHFYKKNPKTSILPNRIFYTRNIDQFLMFYLGVEHIKKLNCYDVIVRSRPDLIHLEFPDLKDFIDMSDLSSGLATAENVDLFAVGKVDVMHAFAKHLCFNYSRIKDSDNKINSVPENQHNDCAKYLFNSSNLPVYAHYYQRMRTFYCDNENINRDEGIDKYRNWIIKNKPNELNTFNTMRKPMVVYDITYPQRVWHRYIVNVYDKKQTFWKNAETMACLRIISRLINKEMRFEWEECPVLKKLFNISDMFKSDNINHLRKDRSINNLFDVLKNKKEHHNYDHTVINEQCSFKQLKSNQNVNDVCQSKNLILDDLIASECLSIYNRYLQIDIDILKQVTLNDNHVCEIKNDVPSKEDMIDFFKSILAKSVTFNENANKECEEYIQNVRSFKNNPHYAKNFVLPIACPTVTMKLSSPDTINLKS